MVPQRFDDLAMCMHQRCNEQDHIIQLTMGACESAWSGH